MIFLQQKLTPGSNWIAKLEKQATTPGNTVPQGYMFTVLQSVCRNLIRGEHYVVLERKFNLRIVILTILLRE